MPVGIRKPGKQVPLQLEEVVDFTGGLNLTDDRFRLAKNESPDMLNVDVDRRGGFQQRRAVRAINPTPIDLVAQAYDDPSTYVKPTAYNGVQTPVLSLVSHHDDEATVVQLLAHCNGRIWSSTGGDFVDTGQLLSDAASPLDSATYDNLTFIGTGRIGGDTLQWDGAAFTALTDPSLGGGDWQGSFTAPSTSHMPKARYVTAHNNMVWAGYTTENGTDFPNRVRFSHPLQGRSWREEDWVDVVSDDGDRIMGLVPWNDHLLVFKRRSVYAIFGFSAEDFSVVPVSTAAGAASHRAIAVTPGGVFFFSEQDGLFSYDGQTGPRWQFEKLAPALYDGSINLANPDEVSVGLVGHRLWVTVPWTAGERTFVLDLTTGAWQAYDLGVHSFKTIWWGTGVQSVAVSPLWSGVVELDVDADVDTYGTSERHITSWYQTRWFTGSTATGAGSPFIPKRWKRPEVILKSGQESTIIIDVLRDYDETAGFKSLTLTTDLYGNAALWGAATWGVDLWSQKPGTFDAIKRAGTIGGQGRSIALRFHGPDTDVGWEVNAFTLKFRPRPPRS